MFEDFEELIKIILKNGTTAGYGGFQRIANTYGVSLKTVHNRFKTYYGLSLRDKIRKEGTPTKKELSSIILNTENVGEFYSTLPMDKNFYKGIFDKFYGVSTYQKAKVEILKEKSTTKYIVRREDNRAVIYSQLFGDGSYDEKRHVLRITHGIKQTEYLKAKVAILNAAYPKLNTEVKIYTHTQGHKYCHYYSGNLGNIDIPKKEDYHKFVDKLTPLGWLLWWLDDGGHYQNIAIFTKNDKLRDAAILELATYGIKARPCQNGFCMVGEQNDILFYKNLIEPLMHYIPECMKYKVKI